ncbi:mitochondrial resolvase Ydc2 [Nemania sp. FL0916]|nr:mitochondrial resolvase Ydc2 [Nemania sp. FL0916]
MAASSAALSLLSRPLRAEQLKRLSLLCGLPLGGRKDELIARLTAAESAVSLPSLPPAKSRSRSRPQSQSQSGPVVLSIDLGIKNLAFSLMTPAAALASSARKADPKRKQHKTADSSPQHLPSNSPPAIELHAWQRLSLLDSPRSDKDKDDAPDADAVVKAANAFTPAVLAQAANGFLQETVLRLDPQPTHILIERQRWRTGGAAAIQEWTLRVNTLEAMLHASLQTLRDVGAWKGVVVSVQPERVGPFFLDDPAALASSEKPAKKKSAASAAKKKKLASDEDGEEARSPDEDDGKKKKKKRASNRATGPDAKKLKIALLGQWLAQGDLVIRPGNADIGYMIDAYRDALPGAGRRSRTKKSAAEESEVQAKRPALDRKLDDVTDSLMQGMAWLRWQENTALLREEDGVEQLLG